MSEPQPIAPDQRSLFAKLTLPLLAMGFAAVLLMPTPNGMKPEAHRLVAVTFLMAGLWVTQVVPLAATSLLPLALFPLLGIQAAKDVSKAFINDNVFLYLGGFVIALSIERWNLHRRIALNIVNMVGAKPRQLVLGFLLSTAGLSMWISNTASTLLMLPIALALLKTMDDEAEAADRSDNSSGGSHALAVPLLLGIAYAASIGGLTTIVGTPTNNAAVGIYHERIPDVEQISVAKWMIACIPIGIVYLALTWLVLTWKLPRSTSYDAEMKQQLRRRLTMLGRMTTAERRVMAVFAATAVLWILRRPLEVGYLQILPGWSDLTERWFAWMGGSANRISSSESVNFINDSTVAILLAVLLFFVPSGTRTSDGRSVPLMNWETATRLPWDIMLLFGGGFALAGAFADDVTGLASWIGAALEEPLRDQPGWVVIAVTCLLMTFLTEFTSNIATVSTILPSLLILCGPLDMDPRLLMVPATLATSCAFMLPIATPPNAIVFGSGRIQVRDMVRYGVLLNLAGVPLLTFGTYWLIRPLMGIS
ncbi:MAG: SLC13 family permease [Fuerstiella sp.]